MDMLEHDSLYLEQSTKLGDAPNSFSCCDREALILKIQTIDSCTRGEARRQVNEMDHSFVRRPEDPPTAPVYVRCPTDYFKLPRWLPRTNQRPLLEPGRT